MSNLPVGQTRKGEIRQKIRHCSAVIIPERAIRVVEGAALDKTIRRKRSQCSSISLTPEIYEQDAEYLRHASVVRFWHNGFVSR